MRTRPSKFGEEFGVAFACFVGTVVIIFVLYHLVRFFL